MGTSGTRSGGLRKGQSPCEWLRALSGFLSSADMDLGVLLESPQGSQSSSREGACTCAFLPSCSSSVMLPFSWIKGLCLSLEAFPGGFPTRLSYVPSWCESILGMNVEAVQGKQFPLEWTETSRGLLEWRHEPGVALAFPVEFLSPFLWRAPPLEMGRGTPGIISRPRRERIPSLEL